MTTVVGRVPYNGAGYRNGEPEQAQLNAPTGIAFDGTTVWIADRKQLVLKFGPASPDTQRRIAAATADDLDRWAERVLTATRVDDVWA